MLRGTPELCAVHTLAPAGQQLSKLARTGAVRRAGRSHCRQESPGGSQQPAQGSRGCQPTASGVLLGEASGRPGRRPPWAGPCLSPGTVRQGLSQDLPRPSSWLPVEPVPDRFVLSEEQPKPIGFQGFTEEEARLSGHFIANEAGARKGAKCPLRTPQGRQAGTATPSCLGRGEGCTSSPPSERPLLAPPEPAQGPICFLPAQPEPLGG